jgi:hypothetical protein
VPSSKTRMGRDWRDLAEPRRSVSAHRMTGKAILERRPNRNRPKPTPIASGRGSDQAGGNQNPNTRQSHGSKCPLELPHVSVRPVLHFAHRCPLLASSKLTCGVAFSCVLSATDRCQSGTLHTGRTASERAAHRDAAGEKGRVQQNHQHEWVFQAQCDLLVNVPLRNRRMDR